jgi:hypothetical protein
VDLYDSDSLLSASFLRNRDRDVLLSLYQAGNPDP